MSSTSSSSFASMGYSSGWRNDNCRIINMEHGLGVEAIRDIRAGEIIVKDSILMSVVDRERKHCVCNVCLGQWIQCSRSNQDKDGIICDSCKQVSWCSSECQDHDTFHASMCPILSDGIDSSETAQNYLFLILNCVIMLKQNEKRFINEFWSLSAPKEVKLDKEELSAIEEVTMKLFDEPLILSIDNTIKSLLNTDDEASFVRTFFEEIALRDKCNALALCVVYNPKHPEQINVRANALYPLISRFNHSCLPNAARRDWMDYECMPETTETEIVALVDIAAGTPITISYIPLNDPNFAPNAKYTRFLHEYGFVCECGCCRLARLMGTEVDMEDEDNEDSSSSGSSNDDDEEEDDEDDDDDENDAEVYENDDITATPGYQVVFRLQFGCQRCTGTMIPVEVEPSSMVCNRCGVKRTQEQFEQLFVDELEVPFA